MSEPLLSLKGINKVFYTDEVETHALSDVNLSIQEGEYVSISGPSGCGKSTLLSILGVLDMPTSGEYILNGTVVGTLSQNKRAYLRSKDVGFVYQSFNLISDLTIQENIELPLIYRGDLDRETRLKMVGTALEQVNMAHRKSHFPSQLSGGQQQRVAVARAIVGKPAIILADEPTGNLDSENAETVMDLLSELHQNGATILMVTHDPRSATKAERNIKMLDGKVVSDGNNDATTTSEHSQGE